MVGGARRAALALGLLAAGWAPPAAAFFCSRVPGPADGSEAPSLWWPTRQVTYTLHAAGTRQLPTEATFAALRQAFAVWGAGELREDARLGCQVAGGTDMQLLNEPATSPDAPVGMNFLPGARRLNIVRFRDDAWPHPADAADTIALTTLTYSALTGQILAAAVEFNSADYTFSLADSPAAGTVDLASIAVHEAGHFLGLAHCGSPTCGDRQVMEPSASRGQAPRRLLACDDWAGMVFKYPKGQPNGFCSGAPGLDCGLCAAPPATLWRTEVEVLDGSANFVERGCAAGGRPGPAAGLGAGLALARAARRRRRRAPAWRATALALAALAATAAAGCAGPDTCPWGAASLAPEAPILAALDVLPSPEADPFRLVLVADLLGGAGALGAGALALAAVGGEAPLSVVPLAAAFGASGDLPLDSPAARVAFSLRLPPLPAGSRRLGLAAQVRDGAGLLSNCYRLELRVQTSAVP